MACTSVLSARYAADVPKDSHEALTIGRASRPRRTPLRPLPTMQKAAFQGCALHRLYPGQAAPHSLPADAGTQPRLPATQGGPRSPATRRLRAVSRDCDAPHPNAPEPPRTDSAKPGNQTAYRRAVTPTRIPRSFSLIYRTAGQPPEQSNRTSATPTPTPNSPDQKVPTKKRHPSSDHPRPLKITAPSHRRRAQALTAIDPWWCPPWNLYWQRGYYRARDAAASRPLRSERGFGALDDATARWLRIQCRTYDQLHPDLHHLLAGIGITAQTARALQVPPAAAKALRRAVTPAAPKPTPRPHAASEKLPRTRRARPAKAPTSPAVRHVPNLPPRPRAAASDTAPTWYRDSREPSSRPAPTQLNTATSPHPAPPGQTATPWAPGCSVSATAPNNAHATACPRYLLRGPAMGPLASGPGMTGSPCRTDDLGGGVTGPGRCRRRR
ncbi:hypothetical protein SUDANB145_07355 (plasmid) [Streptomyces sp. enrichment culture]